MWSEPNHGHGCNCFECQSIDTAIRCSTSNGSDDIYKIEIAYLKNIIDKQAKIIDNLTQILDAKTKGTEQYVPRK